MILYWNIPGRYDGLTIFPFIFIRPASRNDVGLLIHEKVHYEEQRQSWVLPWFLKYGLSKSWRLAAEARAYAAQLAYYESEGKADRLQILAEHLSKNYRLKLTVDQAAAAIQAELSRTA